MGEDALGMSRYGICKSAYIAWRIMGKRDKGGSVQSSPTLLTMRSTHLQFDSNGCGSPQAKALVVGTWR